MVITLWTVIYTLNYVIYICVEMEADTEMYNLIEHSVHSKYYLNNGSTALPT